MTAIDTSAPIVIVVQPMPGAFYRARVEGSELDAVASSVRGVLRRLGASLEMELRRRRATSAVVPAVAEPTPEVPDVDALLARLRGASAAGAPAERDDGPEGAA